MAIITYPLNGIEYTAEDAETYLSTRTSGVFSADISITPENMTVTIGRFLAWINNRNVWGEETSSIGFLGKSVAVTEPVTLNIEPSETILDRIDRIVLRFDAVKNASDITVLKGVSSSTPIPPTISRLTSQYDLCLCEVFVKAGASKITNADITSTILDENLCGIMRDGVTGIPTAQLQEQVNGLLERLQNAISEVQSNSAFMISEVYDPENKAKEVAFKDETVPSDGSATGFNFADNFAQISGDDSEFFLKSVTDLSEELSGRWLGLHNSKSEEKVSRALILYDWEELGGYAIFGMHNKPMGTYLGNSSTIKREIEVGGEGQALIVHNGNRALAIITATGAICKSETNLSALMPSEVSFSDGILTIATDNGIVNGSKYTYTYTVV